MSSASAQSLRIFEFRMMVDHRGLEKPKIPEETKRKAPRRSAPSAKGRGDRKRPSAPAPETTDDVGDQARPGAELAAKKRLFCHVLHPQAGGSPGHPNEGSLELAPTGQILSSKRSNVLPSLPSPMGRTLLDLGPGIVGGFLLVHPTY